MVVRGQADQLEQVIINLLANARDALLGNPGLASRRVRLEQVACREPAGSNCTCTTTAAG